MARIKMVLEYGEFISPEDMSEFLESEHKAHTSALLSLPEGFKLSKNTVNYPFHKLFAKLPPIFCQTWPPNSDDAAVAVIQQQSRAGEDRAVMDKVYLPAGVSPDKLLLILDRALSGVVSALKYEEPGCPYTVLLHTGSDAEQGATFCIAHNGDTFAVEIDDLEVSRLTPWEAADNPSVKGAYDAQELETQKLAHLESQPIGRVKAGRIYITTKQGRKFLATNGGFGDRPWNEDDNYRRYPYVWQGSVKGKVFVATDGYDALLHPGLSGELFSGLQANEGSLRRLHQRHAQMSVAGVTEVDKAQVKLAHKDDATGIVIDCKKLPPPRSLVASSEFEEAKGFNVTELGLYAVLDGHRGKRKMAEGQIDSIYFPDGSAHTVDVIKHNPCVNHAAKYLSRYVQQQLLLEKYHQFYSAFTQAIETGAPLKDFNEQYAAIAQEIEASPLWEFNLLDCVAPKEFGGNYYTYWRTPLQDAIAKRNIPVIMWLLTNGASTDAPGLGHSAGLNAQQYAKLCIFDRLKKLRGLTGDSEVKALEEEVSVLKQVYALLCLYDGCDRSREEFDLVSAPQFTIQAVRDYRAKYQFKIEPQDVQGLLNLGLLERGFVGLVAEASDADSYCFADVLAQLPSYAEYLEPEFGSDVVFTSDEEEGGLELVPEALSVVEPESAGLAESGSPLAARGLFAAVTQAPMAHVTSVGVTQNQANGCGRC